MDLIKNIVRAVALLSVSLSFGWQVSHAAEVPRFDQRVTLHAIEQEVPAFVEALFSQIRVPVNVDEGIEGQVNGLFEGTADQVFEQLANAFNIYLYYDQTVAHVYRSDKLTSSILPLTKTQSAKLMRSAMDMGLPDERNVLKPARDGGLIVSGSKRFADQINELMVAVQKNVKKHKSPVEYRLFRLKYAWADDVSLVIGGENVNIPGVATMLRALISEDPVFQTLSPTRSGSRSTVPKLRGQGLQSVSQLGGVDSSAGQTIVIANGSEGLSEGKNKQASNSSARQSNDFSIVAQPQLNAIAIRDTADRMKVYEQLIQSLDVEPKMVEIEATIIDINSDRQRELGVNWRLQNDGNEFLLGEGTAADLGLRPDEVVTPLGRGGILSLILGDRTQFIARLRALEEVGAAEIVSKPHVITLSNVEAVLGAVTEFFVRVEGNEEVDLFNVPVGTTLRVTPHVFSDRGTNNIKLLVHIEDGAASASKQVDSIPVVSRSTISTQALIEEGSSLLIGGMVRESHSESEVGVPGLARIPGVGRLFKSTRKSSTTTERLFLITPRVVSLSGKQPVRGPVLQGKPADIIATASSRLDGTRHIINTDNPSVTPAIRSTPQRPNRQEPVNPGNSSGALLAKVQASENNKADSSLSGLIAVPPAPVATESSIARVNQDQGRKSQWTVSPWKAESKSTTTSSRVKAKKEEGQWLPVKR